MKALAAVAAGMLLASGYVIASPGSTGARLWSASDLKSADRTLVAEMGQSGAAYTALLRGKTHGALLIHRRVAGDPELHVKLNDFFVILSGAATIEVGGTVTGESIAGPGEKKGRKLTGGTFYTVRRGDVLFIPANHWHQVFVARGQVLRAIVIKAE